MIEILPSHRDVFLKTAVKFLLFKECLTFEKKSKLTKK